MAIVNEYSVCRVESGVDEELGPWKNTIGVMGMDTPNVICTYDGSDWVK